ncbi:MAG: hypothetical protein PHN98_09010 [Smithellaceae bacterium]|nr:hypothetical protein [Smithellaceae bacterium]
MKEKDNENTVGYKQHAFSREDAADIENGRDELAVKIILRVFKINNNIEELKNGGAHDA